MALAAVDEPRHVQADVLANGHARRRHPRTIDGHRRLWRSNRGVATRAGVRDGSTRQARATTLRHAVITHRDHQRHRLADLRRQRLAALHFDSRRRVGANLGAARSGAQRARLRRAHDIVNLIVKPQAREGFFGAALRGQRPDQLVLLGEALWDGNAEDEAVAARQEASRLSLVGVADIEAVVGPHRHVELFFPVPVHVAEHEVLRAIGRLFPPLVRRRHVLPARVRQRLRTRDRRRDQERGHQQCSLRL